MTDFLARANSWPMYLIAAVIVSFVLAQAILFLVKSYKEGLREGMDKALLKKVIISSAAFSLIPSFGILIGVLALAPALGLPVPWIRLSVVGALHYEGATANNLAKGMGLGELPSSLMTGGDLAAIVFGMTVGICWGMLIIIFLFKGYQHKITRTTDKDPKLFNLLFCAMFVGMVSTYAGDAFSYLRTVKLGDTVRTPNVLPVLAMVTSVLFMALFNYLIEKKNVRWLENYALSFSMVLGMTAAVLGQFVFPTMSTFTE
ncbi:MAG: DUF5058 family protein [Oscillospiraceae bacterium]|nr:DUF5058 family protein [Oscillospiraceae bacterium]